MKIFIAGHNGMVGRSIHKELSKSPNNEIITKPRSELDLRNQAEVKSFLNYYKFDHVYIAAAKVGGIYSNNTYPADFIYENLSIQNNLIHFSHTSNVKRLLFLGSSCIYPRDSLQPIKEEYLLSGKLELTNEPYAVAKISGMKLCESYNRQYNTDFRSIMPTNLYGIGDNFHPQNSHVVPGLINKFHEARIQKKDYVSVWGSGNAKREFLYVDDLASAAVFIMNLNKDIYSNAVSSQSSHINIGTGEEFTIKELANIIKDVINFKGDIQFDTSMPDGTPRKLLDSSLISNLGWNHKISLKEGLKKTYSWFLENINA